MLEECKMFPIKIKAKQTKLMLHVMLQVQLHI